MIVELFSKLLLLPFRFFEEFVSAFAFSHKSKEVKTPEVRELRKKVAALYSQNHNQQEMIQLLQGTIEEMEYKQELENKQIEDHWRGIVRDLERQLSQARMR